jgi:ParB/RepB/Spo0J family partition protein
MLTKLEHVALFDITVSSTNEMFRDPAELTKEGLAELIESVKAKGVIQPVLLRPTDRPGKYEVICGERRMHAALFAGLETIPANIRELTDQEAFECQVTENLQRKDVHPLREARAYKYLQDQNPERNTAKELALRFGKSEHYIATRLKLNELIPEIKKDYQAGKLNLGSALIIARLNPEDQKEIKEDLSYRREYESTEQIEDHIEMSIICNLKSAPFKKDDATLNPAMGPCTTCQFRTGGNQLFADVKDKDRCMNRACFAIKREAHALKVLEDAIDNKPDIVLLKGHGEISDTISRLLKHKGLKPLHQYSDFQNYVGGTKAKGLWINSDKMGSTETVYLTKKSKAAAAQPGADPERVKIESDIQRIQEKIDRDRDQCVVKVYKKVWESILVSDAVNTTSGKLSTSEDVLFTYFLFDKIAFGLEDIDDADENELAVKEFKKLKLPQRDDLYGSDQNQFEKFYDKLSTLTVEQKTFLLRRFFIQEFNSGHDPEDVESFMIMKFAQGIGIDVAGIREEQERELADQEEKAKQRIKDLKAQLKDPKPKKSKKKSEPVEA